MSEPTRRTCDLVDARDGYQCVRCGKSVYECLFFSRHHRHMRSHPFKGLHLPANVILLCGSCDSGCHGWVHQHPREAMGNGWLVSGFNDHPEQVPILTHLHGWVLIDNQGGHHTINQQQQQRKALT